MVRGPSFVALNSVHHFGHVPSMQKRDPRTLPTCRAVNATRSVATQPVNDKIDIVTNAGAYDAVPNGNCAARSRTNAEYGMLGWTMPPSSETGTVFADDALAECRRHAISCGRAILGGQSDTPRRMICASVATSRVTAMENDNDASLPAEEATIQPLPENQPG